MLAHIGETQYASADHLRWKAPWRLTPGIAEEAACNSFSRAAGLWKRRRKFGSWVSTKTCSRRFPDPGSEAVPIGASALKGIGEPHPVITSWRAGLAERGFQPGGLMKSETMKTSA